MEVDRNDPRLVIEQQTRWEKLMRRKPVVIGRVEGTFDTAEETQIQLPASPATEGDRRTGRLETFETAELFPGYPVTVDTQS